MTSQSSSGTYALHEPREFPNEIHDYIIDHLWNDPRALATCSLVCRSFVPTARLHLFETITLGADCDCLRFLELAKISGSSSTGALRYVRTLSLTTSDEQDRDWINPWFSQILRYLQNIEYLKLERICLTSEGLEAMSVLGRSVKALRLAAVSFPQPREFFALLFAYPKLTDLDLDFVGFSLGEQPPELVSPAEIDDTVLSARSPLARLSMKMCDVHFTSAIVSILLQPPLRSALCHVTCHDPQPYWSELQLDKMPPINALIRGAGGLLRSLKLQIWDHNFYKFDKMDTLDLSPSTQLQSLTFHTASSISEDLNRETAFRWSWMPTVLLRLRSPVLHLIDFTIETSGIAQKAILEDLFDWAHMDEVLASLKQVAPQLSVTFHIGSNVEDQSFLEDILQVVMTSLPRVWESGMRVGVYYRWLTRLPMNKGWMDWFQHFWLAGEH